MFMRQNLKHLGKYYSRFLLISVLTELWHLIDVNAVAGHSAMPVALLFYTAVNTEIERKK